VNQSIRGQLQLPYNIVRPEIEKNLEAKVGEIRRMAQTANTNRRETDLEEWSEIYNEIQSNNPEKAKEIMEKIRQKQEAYQTVMGEQEALMKLKKAAALSPSSTRSSPTPTGGSKPGNYYQSDAMDDVESKYERRREIDLHDDEYTDE
jgi:hypothetical protein